MKLLPAEGSSRWLMLGAVLATIPLLLVVDLLIAYGFIGSLIFYLIVAVLGASYAMFLSFLGSRGLRTLFVFNGLCYLIFMFVMHVLVRLVTDDPMAPFSLFLMAPVIVMLWVVSIVAGFILQGIAKKMSSRSKKQ